MTMSRAAMGDHQLEVQLAKRFDGFDLDVSWGIGDDLAVLFGYSGSGKSLTLRMIAGLVRPDSGRVVLDGEVVFDASSGRWVPPQERRLGFVFQDLALFPHMTVRKNIAYGLNHLSKRERRERADEYITRFHLEGLADRYPWEISGGQKQRVGLARALAGRPRALLLDEPFSALDLPLKTELWQVLLEIRETLRIPMVVVTHDPVDARNLSDHLIVYQAGRVLRSDCPAEALKNPTEPELLTLAAAGASFDDVSEWVSGLELVPALA
ncbi:MAG: ATP-binding cassette domain-containing protein [Thermoleophilia bacterium]|nr:ATP-binding cassette domain-containing protein [Thermoleophilia bacterium]